jgi:alpha-glucan,water dikinase
MHSYVLQVGLNFDDVRMAVLVQRVVPAQYAFVIHTRNPSNNDDQEVFCELVRGLGESRPDAQLAA